MAKTLHVVLVLAIALGIARASLLPNFLAVDVLDDGEMERRFSFNGVAAKETSAIITINGTR